MKQLGTQLIAELGGCPHDVLASIDRVKVIMEEGARAAQATIVNSSFKQFEPYGVSGVITIAESHITIHTWPEHGYAAIDVFTCGPMNSHAAVAHIAHELGAQEQKVTEIPRGI